jgi:hypothetical protein
MAAKSNVDAGLPRNRLRGASRSANTTTRDPTGRRFDRDVLDRLARELLGVCAKALVGFRANPGARAASALRGFPRQAKYAAQMHDDADKLSLIHTKWQLKTGYFDEDGHPKIIAILGPSPSYESLCADCGLGNDWERLLKLALTFRMCSRVGRDRLANLSEITLLTGTPLMLARAVVNIERFLKTVEYNARPRKKMSESLADRTAVVNLSEAEFRGFSTAMRGILHDFVESSDRRLLAGVSRDDSQPKKNLRRRLSGVSAFVFRD